MRVQKPRGRGEMWLARRKQKLHKRNKTPSKEKRRVVGNLPLNKTGKREAREGRNKSQQSSIGPQTENGLVSTTVKGGWQIFK